MDKTEEVPKDFITKLQNIRFKPYPDALDEFSRELDMPATPSEELKDISEELQVKAMIIVATKRSYGNELNIKGEIVLMSLKLLKGYSHNECVAESEEKYIRFLKESSYLQEVYYGGRKYSTYEEVLNDNAEEKVVNTLKAAATRYMKPVAKKLYYHLESIYDEICKNKNDYFREYEISKNKRITRNILPEMNHRQKNNRDDIVNVAANQHEDNNQENANQLSIILNKQGSYIGRDGVVYTIDPNDIHSLRSALDDICAQAIVEPGNSKLQQKAKAICDLLMAKGDRGRVAIKQVLDGQAFDEYGQCLMKSNTIMQGIVERIVQSDHWMSRTERCDAGFAHLLYDFATAGEALRSCIAYAAITAENLSPMDTTEMSQTVINTFRRFIAEGAMSIDCLSDFERCGYERELHIAADTLTIGLTNERTAVLFKLKDMRIINLIRKASYYAEVRGWMYENGYSDVRKALVDFEKQYGGFQYIVAGDKLSLPKHPVPKGFTETGIWIGASLGMGSIPTKQQKVAFDKWQNDFFTIDDDNNKNDKLRRSRKMWRCCMRLIDNDEWLYP